MEIRIAFFVCFLLRRKASCDWVVPLIPVNLWIWNLCSILPKQFFGPPPPPTHTHCRKLFKMRTPVAHRTQYRILAYFAGREDRPVVAALSTCLATSLPPPYTSRIWKWNFLFKNKQTNTSNVPATLRKFWTRNTAGGCRKVCSLMFSPGSPVDSYILITIVFLCPWS